MANLAQASNVLLTTKLAITATIARKRFVKPDGSGYPASGGNALGVSLFPGVSGDTLDIAKSGFIVVTAGGSLNRGDWVMSDASGQAIAATALGIASGGTTVTSAAANGTTDIVGGMPPTVVLGQVVECGGASAASGDDVLIYM